MRNRPVVTRGARLFMAAVLLFTSALSGQTARQDLARAAWLRPLPEEPVDGSPGHMGLALPATIDDHPTVLRWYHGLAFVGMLAALSSQDKGIRNEIQSGREGTRDDIARTVRHLGQPEVYATVALGTVATGLISGNPRLTRAGARISSGIALGGVVSTLIKLSVGRRRPFSAADQYTFGPFSKADASFPSGHTMTAFALVTGVSDEVHSLPVSIALYTLATGVGWSRMNDNKHWLTDVVAGAAIGVTSAKIMNGHWRVFGISAPRVLLEPKGGAGLAWSASF
jgi:membrane-associated phospholipid phosphatase